MIAVVGRLGSGGAVSIARRAAGVGAKVELVTTVPQGAAGDARLAELAQAGVHHAAALRSPAPNLEPADLELALRYLPDVRVVVLADDVPALASTASGAAAWSGASLVVVTSDEDGVDIDDPAAIVLAGPPRDPDDAFAGVVADLAARLDAGEEPGAAWRAVGARLGLEGLSLAKPAPRARR